MGLKHFKEESEEGGDMGEGAVHIGTGSPRKAFRLIPIVRGRSWRGGGNESCRQEREVRAWSRMLMEKLGSNRWVKKMFVSA